MPSSIRRGLICIICITSDRGMVKNKKSEEWHLRATCKAYEPTHAETGKAGGNDKLERRTYAQVLTAGSDDVKDGTEQDGPNNTIMDRKGAGVGAGGGMIGGEVIWSDIPSVLLPMINKNLDFPNRLRFAAVCKSWRSELMSFQDHCEVERPPWIMIHDEDSSSKREFISISSLERYVFDFPEFASTTCLASKKGWLLLLNDMWSNKTHYTMFFFNPFTKERFEMPPLSKPREGRYEHPADRAEAALETLAAFTTLDGYPHRVAFISPDDWGIENFTVRVACHGDGAWKEVPVKLWRYKCQHSIVYTMIVGSTLYCFSDKACVVLINVDTKRIWCGDTSTIEQENFEIGRFYFVECQGKILMLRFAKNFDEDFKVYRLITGDTITEMMWEIQDEEDFDESSHFLHNSRFKWEELDLGADLGSILFFLNIKCTRPGGYAMEKHSCRVPNSVASVLPLETTEDFQLCTTNNNRVTIYGAWSPKNEWRWQVVHDTLGWHLIHSIWQWVQLD